MTQFSSLGMGTYGSTWQHGGYSGTGSVGELLGSLTGRPALIAGNAASVFEDLQEARCHLSNPVLFAVNDVGMFLPDLDHWVSLHADNLPRWKAVRWQDHRGPEHAVTHSCDTKPGVDYAWTDFSHLMALSGYFAMQVAYLMGCAPIVLCGCPGSVSRRFFEAAPRDGFGYGGGVLGADTNIQDQIKHEMQRLPEFKAVVRSMSGWTHDFFGGIESWQTSRPMPWPKPELLPK